MYVHYQNITLLPTYHEYVKVVTALYHLTCHYSCNAYVCMLSERNAALITYRI